MIHWKRQVVRYGFKWTGSRSGTVITVQIKGTRWTACVSTASPAGEREKNSFFVEDRLEASLQKCLLYVWRTLDADERSTFDVREALIDLRRFVP